MYFAKARCYIPGPMTRRPDETNLTVPLNRDDLERFEDIRNSLGISKGRFAAILVRFGIRHADDALGEAVREVKARS